MVGTKVLYAGRVQGVGFRATTAGLARGFAVDGSVRNLEDGRVEVVARGEAAEVEAFLEAIRAALGDKIRGVGRESVEPGEPSGEFRVLI